MHVGRGDDRPAGSPPPPLLGCVVGGRPGAAGRLGSATASGARPNATAARINDLERSAAQRQRSPCLPGSGSARPRPRLSTDKHAAAVGLARARSGSFSASMSGWSCRPLSQLVYLEILRSKIYYQLRAMNVLTVSSRRRRRSPLARSTSRARVYKRAASVALTASSSRIQACSILVVAIFASPTTPAHP